MLRHFIRTTETVALPSRPLLLSHLRSWQRRTRISLLLLALGFMVPFQAQAEGPGCTDKDIGYWHGTGLPKEERIKFIQAKLAACKGRLTEEQEAQALDFLHQAFMHPPPDYEGCRRVMERMIQLGHVRNYTQNNYDFGYCGGDCKKSPEPDSCERGKLRHEKALAEKRHLDTDAKVGSDFEMDQPVPCDPTKARKLIAKMDKLLFHGLALRFASKYEKDCAQAKDPGTRIAIANDKALVLFHKGDDSACLRTLDTVNALPTASKDTAFNRALCGGTCSMDLIHCAKAQQARNKALADRAVFAKQRSLDGLSDPPAGGCGPGTSTRTTTHALSWDLKTFRECERGKCAARRHPMIPVGDLDGDGYGEYLNKEEQVEYFGAGTSGNEETPRHHYLVFNVFSNIDLCAKGDVTELYSVDTKDVEDQDFPLAFTEKITTKPNSRVKSFCVYPTKNLKCSASGCNLQPYGCLDQSEGGKEKTEASKP